MAGGGRVGRCLALLSWIRAQRRRPGVLLSVFVFWNFIFLASLSSSGQSLKGGQARRWAQRHGAWPGRQLKLDAGNPRAGEEHHQSLGHAATNGALRCGLHAQHAPQPPASSRRIHSRILFRYRRTIHYTVFSRVSVIRCNTVNSPREFVASRDKRVQARQLTDDCIEID